MALYSHSRLGTFETCKLQYKCRYIDKIKVDTDTVEKHLGKMAHDTLEKLYKDLLMGKMNSKDELLSYYEKLWERNWHDKIMIVKTEYNAGHYWKRGQRSISDYYDYYYPFDQGKTVGLESRIIFDLDPKGKHKIQGFIDRLVYAGDGVYEIHDYKTASHPPTDESLKQDRQLALYQIYVQEKYTDAKKVKLIWHYLTFGKEFSSERTNDELEDLKKRTLKLIEELEATKDFPPRECAICPWCDYQYLCPIRKHLIKVESLPIEEYENDDGVKLVNKWVELQKRKREIEKQLELLKPPLISFSEKEDCRIIAGNTHKLRITEDTSWQFPGTGLKEMPNREELISILKDSGKYKDVCSLDIHALKKIIMNEKWSIELIDKIKSFGSTKITHRISQSKLKDDDRAD